MPSGQNVDKPAAEGKLLVPKGSIVLPTQYVYRKHMPHWMLIVLFCGVISALAVIVKWELKRLRRPPGFVPGALKQFLAFEADTRQARAVKETKRGFDS